MDIQTFIEDSANIIKGLYKTTTDLDGLVTKGEPKAIVNGEPVYDDNTEYFYSISGNTKGSAQMYGLATQVEPSDLVFYMITNPHLSDRFLDFDMNGNFKVRIYADTILDRLTINITDSLGQTQTMVFNNKYVVELYTAQLKELFYSAITCALLIYYANQYIEVTDDGLQ